MTGIRVSSMTATQAAWVAGIVDGEGCISWITPANGTNQARIKVKMTDLDVIERLQSWTGVGTIFKVGKTRADRKQAWVWTVTVRDDFLTLAYAIEPWLLSRRAARLREVREALNAHRADVLERQWIKATVCPRGDLKQSSGTCRDCETRYQRIHRQKAADSVNS